MKNLVSLFWFKAPLMYAYMLQQFEYNPGKFAAWAIRLPNLFKVQKRGKIDLTSRAKLMVAVAYLAWVFGLLTGIVSAILLSKPLLLLICLLAPLVTVVSVLAITLALQKIVISPSQNKEIAQAKAKLAGFSATRIAVLGSYGKTTMKELLMAVISESKKVAATPGNKNVLISHARWINQKLSGTEHVLIYEYGEAAPGDIAKLAAFSIPHIVVVTGLAPAHLDAYPSVEAVADDFASIRHLVDAKNTFVQGNSELLKSKIKGSYYSAAGMDDWKVSNVNIDFSGTSFSVSNGKRTLQVMSGLLGAHQIGPLVAVIAVAVDLGLTDEQITAGVAKTVPFEHRMQPRQLNGAWIIDDTYNGNIEGMRAGLELLKTLPAKRKIYVTPGLVDQGSEIQKIHEELGRLIAKAGPDQVVIMQNSATQHIKTGLQNANYNGKLTVETNPLEYYTNLEHHLAAGDLVMMQNDWPDSYR